MHSAFESLPSWMNPRLLMVMNVKYVSSSTLTKQYPSSGMMPYTSSRFPRKTCTYSILGEVCIADRMYPFPVLPYNDDQPFSHSKSNSVSFSTDIKKVDCPYSRIRTGTIERVVDPPSRTTRVKRMIKSRVFKIVLPIWE